MKSRFLILFTIGLIGFMGTAYATIVTTPFELQISSDDFIEPTPGKYHLVMKPGDSQQITIHVTNNDVKTHTVNLQMTNDFQPPERIFVFEPNQLEIKSGDTKSSILTVSTSNDASSGTTIMHTLIAKSTTFGAKGFGFFVKVSDTVSPPSPDPPYRDGPGMMFPSTTQFGLPEKDAYQMVPYDVFPPNLPTEYSFQGIYDPEKPMLIYSKKPVSESAGEREFWNNGGLLIIFDEKDEFHSYDDYLHFLNPNEQQVLINEKNAILSYAEASMNSNEKTHSSRVIIFLDDAQIRLESHMKPEQLLRISESMIVNESNVADTNNFRHTENPNECWYQDDDGNIVPCKMGSDSFDMAVGMFFIIFWPYIILGILIVIIFMIWKKRR